MKFIKQSYEILGTPKSLDEAWEFVAKAARNCYLSEKTNSNETEEQFCKRVLLKGKDFTKLSNEERERLHLSPFEFGIVYLTIPFQEHIEGCYGTNPYSRWETDEGVTNYYITSNLRAIIENHWEEDLKYAGPPSKYHVKSCAFKLITNRAIMCELTRHRTLSFCVESTRYCNYSKGKFGNELTYIYPCWLPDYDDTDWSEYHHALYQIERDYMSLVSMGVTPQQAATILPNALKTTIMMCGYEDNLQHMFRLRAEECSGPVHPQMKELMKPLYKSYKEYMEWDNYVGNR